MRYAYVLMIILVFFVLSCVNNVTEQPLNPNGDSELALLMRQMYDDGILIKQSILDEKEFKIYLKHEKILIAKALDPDKTSHELFQPFAKNYLDWMTKMNDSNNLEKEATYSNLVSSCITCHETICPGPLVKIEKLLLE